MSVYYGMYRSINSLHFVIRTIESGRLVDNGGRLVIRYRAHVLDQRLLLRMVRWKVSSYRWQFHEAWMRWERNYVPISSWDIRQMQVDGVFDGVLTDPYDAR